MYFFLKNAVNELIWETLSNGKIKPSTEKTMKNAVNVIMSFAQQQQPQQKKKQKKKVKVISRATFTLLLNQN